jgi:hypothetical protein
MCATTQTAHAQLHALRLVVRMPANALAKCLKRVSRDRGVHKLTSSHSISRCLQEFPYPCEPGIEHLNIWCTQPLDHDAIWRCVEQKRPSAEYDVLMFVNPRELQSVPTVCSTSPKQPASGKLACHNMSR